MTGIYKILSPTGRVYIGQSYNIVKRFSLYKYIHSKSPKSLINRSLIKYGSDNHVFSIIHELPLDVDKDTITRYEQFYLDQYKDTGHEILNLCPCAGSPKGFKRPKEQLERHSKIMKGKPSPMKGKNHSDETKEKIRLSRKGTKLSDETKEKLKGRIAWNKGLKMPPGFYPPRVVSEETKEKLRQINTGKKLSPETIAKRTKTLQENFKIKPKKGWSEEAKKRQSERLKEYCRNKIS
jgi:group I intron endonuclease